jgi:hypothetical protein
MPFDRAAGRRDWWGRNMSDLCALITRHCHRDTTPTAVPRLMRSRSSVTTELAAAMYHPLLCVVAQGRKRIFPALFLHAARNVVCDTVHSRLAEPMREDCADLTASNLLVLM